MKKSPDPISEAPDGVVSGKGLAGQSACETKSEKAIRHEAQIIAKIYAKALPEALAIARTSLAAKAVADGRFRDKQRNLARKKKQRRMEGPKKSGYIYKVHGPALPGGLPGLGKRK